MTKTEVIGKIQEILELFQTLKDLDDDDGWYLAMHSIRELAWEGKEIVHAKRLAEHEAKRVPLTYKVGRAKTQVSSEELDQIMKDLGL